MKFRYSRLSAVVKPAVSELRKSRRPLDVPHSTFEVVFSYYAVSIKVIDDAG